MLPQKKNLLRRNAWYRQQLLQLAPAYPAQVPESARKHNANTDNRQPTTAADKP